MFVTYNQTATVDVELSLDLNPEDYLDFDSEEEVASEIYDIVSEDIDYGDCDLSRIDDDTLEIPEEFWEEWRRLKNDKN